MIKLSERLQRIADCVETGKTLADVGSDHGFLPLYLWERKISPRLVLTDLRPGPLEKAAANIALYAPGETFDLRMGSGLRPLSPGEVDTVVIAGMGGHLIASILAEDLPKTKSFRRFVLQPRNAQDKLREWLYETGLSITEEYLAREGRYICEIIVADTAASTSITGGGTVAAQVVAAETLRKSLAFEVSPLLINQKDPLLKELIQRKINMEEKIWRATNCKESPAGQRRAEIAGNRLTDLNNLLQYVVDRERMELVE